MPAGVPAILATIREMEGGCSSPTDNGCYHAQNPTSTASGAYQYLDTTWNGYGGYRRAADAPPAVQDQKATEDVNGALSTFGNVKWVPVVWYGGGGLAQEAYNNPSILNQTPPGNSLSYAAYQQRWLATYAKVSGDASVGTGSGSESLPATLVSSQGSASAPNNNCIIGGGSISLPIVGGPGLPCLLNKSGSQALLGGGLIFAGVVLMLGGVAVLVVAGFGGNKAVSTLVGVVPGASVVQGFATKGRVGSASGGSGGRSSAQDRFAERSYERQRREGPSPARRQYENDRRTSRRVTVEGGGEPF